MEQQTTRDFAARIARTAFDMGLHAAPHPRSEVERRRVSAQTTAQDMLAAHIEAEVERRLSAEGSP